MEVQCGLSEEYETARALKVGDSHCLTGSFSRTPLGAQKLKKRSERTPKHIYVAQIFAKRTAARLEEQETVLGFFSIHSPEQKASYWKDGQ